MIKADVLNIWQKKNGLNDIRVELPVFCKYLYLSLFSKQEKRQLCLQDV